MLPSLQGKRQAIVVCQFFQRGRLSVFGEVRRRTTYDATIGKKPYRHIVRVRYAAYADAHVIAFAHQVDKAVGQVEGQLQIRELLVKA
ncbi:hypothetical protein D3C85_1279240 [compost metagenome]